MQLVHLGIEVEFEESSQFYTPARRVFSAFGGRVGESRPREPGATVRITDVPALIKWQYDKCAIAIERTADHDECISRMVRYLETVDGAARIGNIRGAHLISYWILPAPKHSFASLEELYRRTMIAQEGFMESTYDSSVILDMTSEDCTLHHQSGAMEPKQLLKDYLEFEQEGLPEVFLFLYAGVRQRKVIQYSKREMRRFVEEAFGHCDRHSAEFGRMWEGSV